MATVRWTACFALTIVISLLTARTRTNEELKGLVYSLTPRVKSEHETWYHTVTVGAIVHGRAII